MPPVTPQGEIDLVRAADLRWLLTTRDTACVSVYLPTHRHAPGTDQDPIRLRALVGEARAVLSDLGLSHAEIEEILAPVESLLDDEDFSRHQADGLAVFAMPGECRHFRLPIDVETLVRVGTSFALRPLVPLLAGDGHFFVLALSRNDVRCFEGTRLTMAQLALDDVPTSMDAALGGERPEQQLQMRTGGPGGGEGHGAIFHGHRGGDEDTKEALGRYFRAVDRGLASVLDDQHAPLVVAGVAYYLPLYRSVSRYPNIADEAVEGAAESLDATELHRRAWEIVAPGFDEARHAALGALDAAHETGRRSLGVATVVPAAAQGRVEVLFVSPTGTAWGHYDPKSATVETVDTPGPDEHDLLDLAISGTLRTGGTVYAAEPADLPDGSPVAALLRY